MNKRLFFAITLPEEIKNKIDFHKKNLEKNLDRGVRWANREDFHITIFFLGHVKTEVCETIINKVKRIKTAPFHVRLENISYFPKNKRKTKMIWINGESLELSRLQKRILKVLDIQNDDDFKTHITLGRIKKWEFQKIPFYEIPDIDERIDIEFKVLSFELFESKLNSKGPQYFQLKSFELKNEK
jgi:RNA 2',3'-cyclic 3'-phosphodiesterase